MSTKLGGDVGLKDSIDKLQKTQEKAVSLKWTFFRGVFNGLGFFVGGTLLVALLIYILSLFDTAPIIGEYISKILHLSGSGVGK